MTRTIPRKFALASLLLATGGCAMMAGGDVKPLTPVERQETQKAYGDEVAKDVDSLLATTPRTAPIFERCLSNYMRATSGQKEEGARMQRSVWAQCDSGCRKEAKGPHAALAAKYRAMCQQGLAGSSSEEFVHRMRKKMEALRESKKPDDWLQNKTDVEEVILDARKELGGDIPEMKPLVEEYEQLITEHRRDLERALGFYKRQDIAAMRSEMSRLKLEIASLGDKPRTDGGQALMMVKQRRYDDLKEKIDQEARKAGIR